MFKLKSYKGYEGYLKSIDEHSGDLVGRVAGIRDIISFAAPTYPDLQAQFEASVDDYLEQCAEDGVEPNKPANGTITVRMESELHRQAQMLAEASSESLNAFITRVIADAVARLLGHNKPALAQTPESYWQPTSQHPSTWCLNKIDQNKWYSPEDWINKYGVSSTDVEELLGDEAGIGGVHGGPMPVVVVYQHGEDRVQVIYPGKKKRPRNQLYNCYAFHHPHEQSNTQPTSQVRPLGWVGPVHYDPNEMPTHYDPNSPTAPAM